MIFNFSLSVFSISNANSFLSKNYNILYRLIENKKIKHKNGPRNKLSIKLINLREKSAKLERWFDNDEKETQSSEISVERREKK